MRGAYAIPDTAESEDGDEARPAAGGERTGDEGSDGKG
jgi:hypothetical protein